MAKVLKKKRLLLAISCLLLSVELCACGPSLISPSQEDILPSQDQQVEYIAKPPGELGKLVFSYELGEQQGQDNWNKYRGKWVVWSGKVTDIIPKLKPSKLVLVYDYETPPLTLSAGKFAVEVINDVSSEWTEDLERLSEGETCYYRAKLAQRKTGLFFWEEAKYGKSLDGLLELKDGEIINNDHITAKLVDMVYASYEQLNRLVEEAEEINAVENFFEGKLKQGRRRIAIETILKLGGVDISDKYWLLEKEPLPKMRAHKNVTKSEIEEHLQKALLLLHSNTPRNERLYEEIEQVRKIGETAVETAEDSANIIKDFWEEEKKSAEPGISDLICELVVSKLSTIIGVGKIGVGKTVVEGILEAGKLNAYEIIVGGCSQELYHIDCNIEELGNRVVEVVDKVTRETK